MLASPIEMSGRKTGRIAHITSVHRYDDTRIFHKECVSLAKQGYEVYLIAQSDQTQRRIDGVMLTPITPAHGRLPRMTRTISSIFREVQALKPDVVHFHDPELIPLGLLLKVFGRSVIYDVHENYSQQILAKPWIPRSIRRSVSVAFSFIERISVRMFDGVVCASAPIEEKISSSRSVLVRNFPIRRESQATRSASHSSSIIYVGGISRERGVIEMVRAMSYVPTTLSAKLVLVGDLPKGELQDVLAHTPGWEHTLAVGRKSLAEVNDLLTQAVAGLVLLHPVPRYMEALPTKLFEYMSAGVPVVASDFPLWAELVEAAQCGVTVDPTDPEAIAEAIASLVGNPEMAREFGLRGQQAVADQFNWDHESEALVNLYRRLLADV